MSGPDTLLNRHLRLDNPQIPRGARIFWRVISVGIVGYCLYGVIVNDLVIPAGRYSSAPGHLHAPASLIALVSAMCFSFALRATVLDHFVRYGHDPRFRLRAATLVLIILSFALFFSAMIIQFQADVAALIGTFESVSTR